MKSKIIEIKNHIKKVYSHLNRPFVIGFSGGKDSTVTLQLVWEAISEVPQKDRNNSIFVVSTDTLVETPYIIDFITDVLQKIKDSTLKNNLPITPVKLEPQIEDSFWVNLIGKGYPAPSQQFRWCTERLKIKPVSRFVEKCITESREVTLVIGARREESASRNQVLSKKVRDNFGLSKHPTLSGSYVFTPIEHLTTEEVWAYLLNNENPWGGSNRDLAAMYQNAGGGECPMVISDKTQPCGNSRFGCWVCTLVQKDTTMENLIDSGEDWMIPLYEFRELLNETQVPSKKSIYRSYKRRNGQVSLIRDKTRIAYGPYKFKWRKKFLEELLYAQIEVQTEGPDPSLTLISLKELELIRKHWREEEFDWEDSVPAIYQNVTGKEYPLPIEDGVLFNKEDLQLLKANCENEGLQVNLVARLLDLEKSMQGITRRVGVIEKMDKIIREEWRTEEEIVDSLGLKNED